MFSGPILPLVIKIALPVFLGLIAQLVYNITDTVWISLIDRKDPSYIGGTGIIFPIIFFATALATGLSVGISSITARAIGEKNYGILNKTVESGLCIALCFSAVLIAVFYLFTDQSIRLLGAKGDYFVHAREYLVYIIPAAVVLFIINAFFGILMGEGLIRYVMITMIIGTVLNIFLDPLFIFIFKMGVGGAALATTLSQAIACVYIIFIFLKGKSIVKIEFKWHNISMKIMKEIFSIGIPQAISMILTSVNIVFTNYIIISIDPLGVTAFSLNSRFDQCVFIPIIAISNALVTVIGQNAGRGQLARVEQIWKRSLFLVLACTVVTAFVMVVAAPFIYGKLTDVPEVLRYSVLQTRITEFAIVFAAVGNLAGSAFQAIGYPIPSILILVFRSFGLYFPVMLFLVYCLQWRIYGVWGALIFDYIGSAVLGFFWFSAYLKKVKSGLLAVRSTRI